MRLGPSNIWGGGHEKRVVFHVIKKWWGIEAKWYCHCDETWYLTMSLQVFKEKCNSFLCELEIKEGLEILGCPHQTLLIEWHLVKVLMSATYISSKPFCFLDPTKYFEYQPLKVSFFIILTFVINLRYLRKRKRWKHMWMSSHFLYWKNEQASHTMRLIEFNKSKYRPNISLKLLDYETKNVCVFACSNQKTIKYSRLGK